VLSSLSAVTDNDLITQTVIVFGWQKTLLKKNMRKSTRNFLDKNLKLYLFVW